MSILQYFESVNILPVAQEYAMEGRIISVDVGSKVLSDASFEVAKTSRGQGNMGGPGKRKGLKRLPS